MIQIVIDKREHKIMEYIVNSRIKDTLQPYIAIHYDVLTIGDILIKYEDLHKETENHFKRILIFLSKFVKIEINDDKIKKTVEQCSFKNLSNLESQKGFEERKGKTNFFRKGSANEWQELLPKTLIEKIESNFSEEMKVLKYL